MSEHDHRHRGDEEALTRNQALVYGALTAAETPLSAYTILDRLRDDGFRAPLQVYRALDKLVELGMVHRLESLNAFVACRHPACEAQSITVFSICSACGAVSEAADEALEGLLRDLAGRAGFTLDRAAVELRGRCSACSNS